MKRPLAPTLPPEDQSAPNPLKEYAERRKAAIESRVKDPQRSAAADGGVDGAAPPPKPSKTGTTPVATPAPSSQNPAPATKDSPASASDTSSTPTPDAANSEQTPSPEKAAAPEAKGPRYDVKSFKRWAEANPEAALEFAASIKVDVFRDGEDPKQEWIRQQQKARKIKGDIETRTTESAAKLKAEREAIDAERKTVQGIADQITYLSEMWGGATRKNASGHPDPDFDTIDEAFRQNTGGMSIDDYNRLRARRGAANPETARLRAEVARLSRLTQTNGAPAQAPAGTKGAGAPTVTASPSAANGAPAPAPAASRDAEAFWGDDVPKAHALRQFAGWAAELDAEMAKYHDETLDEYSKDPEEIADKLLQRKIAAFSADDEEEAPAPKRKPAAQGKPNVPKRRTPADSATPTNVPGIPNAAKLTPRGQVNPDRSHRLSTADDLKSDGGAAERRRYAMDRAAARLRGELVED